MKIYESLEIKNLKHEMTGQVDRSTLKTMPASSTLVNKYNY